MLLQSAPNAIRLLPALPKEWEEGFVKGLRARGALEVDINWRKGQLTTAVIRSIKQSNLKVKYADKMVELGCSAGDSIVLDKDLNIIKSN